MKSVFSKVEITPKIGTNKKIVDTLDKVADALEKKTKSNDIWKDPKVELPKSYELGAIGSDSIFIVIGIGHFAIVECIENKFVEIDYSCDRVIKDYTDYTITKWAYCKDLIKQAGGK